MVTGIDWAGLSARTVRGWFRGTQCLAHCDEMHTGGRWCLTDQHPGGARGRLRRHLVLVRCTLGGGHTGGRLLGAHYLCGRCSRVVDITTGRARR